MPEYRYHRMADNVFGWKSPHAGRLGVGKGYVSQQGFGHEDWNFAKDVWDDGRYHLYLKQAPREVDRNKKFNIVLGVHTAQGAMIAGFAENVEYSESDLPDIIWRRRAEEIKILESVGQLEGKYKGMSVSDIAKDLQDIRGIYNVSLAAVDLHVLDVPKFIDRRIYSVVISAFRLLSMIDRQYKDLRGSVGSDLRDRVDLDENGIFPEGAQVEKVHRSRERNWHLVRLAKQAFVERHGALYCEACEMEPSSRFGDSSLAGKIIEAHHNVPIADANHLGVTRIQDLSMLCPSCHRAIHSIRPWLSVKDLRRRLES